MGEYLIKMPDVGEGITEAEIGEWSVKVGDQVNEGDILCAIITDKAAVELPCAVAGRILWTGAEAGEVLAVGSPLVRLEVPGAGNIENDNAIDRDRSPADNRTGKEPSAAMQPENGSAANAATVASREAKTISPGPAPKAGKPQASPSVRRRANAAGVDLHKVRGSGPAQRIGHEDLDAYIEGGAANATAGHMLTANTSVKEIKIIGVRRMIAQKMQEAKRHIPHFGYVEEVDMTEVEALRNKMNTDRSEDQAKLTPLTFLIRAIIHALVEYPQMSARFDDAAGIVSQYGAAHIGIATQTPAGLVVPVLRHAEAMNIWTTAAEIRRLADAARNGDASREELSGSTLTITSLGAIGGIATAPVINHPEVAIIGMNKIAKRPLWQDGGFIPRDMMNLSSAFDHRIIDGWDAACFIQHIKASLENPAILFMEV